MSNMRVLVLVSDKYLSALKPYAYLFNRYWSREQQVLVAGFTPPDFELPSNFSFHSIGKFEDYPVSKWSDALIKLLNEIDDEAFALALEDYWLTRPVDVRGMRYLYDYARQFGYVLRIDLTTDRLFAHGPRYPGDIADYGYVGHLDLIRSEPTSQYHMSMMMGIWRRDNLLKVLIPGETPWQLELDGTRRVMTEHAHDMLVLGTRQSPVKHHLAFRGGDSNTLKLDGLRHEDVKALTELGYLKPWGIE